MWDYNLYPGEPAVIAGAHDIVADPQFIDIQLDPTRGDFRLKSGSPGIGSATDELPQPADVPGRPHPAGSGRNRGAFEN